MSTCATGLLVAQVSRPQGGTRTCAGSLAEGAAACRLLEEKDLLLRELGHRVRNSLTVIASLAYAESESIRDAEAAASIERLKNRVEATALLYERLDLDGGSPTLRADHYLAEVATLVRDSFALAGNRVSMELLLAPTRVGAREAGSLGLIVNEATTNAFKYGILKGGGKTLRISLGAKGRGWRLLVIEDDGPGFPVDFDPARDGDFGFELMMAEAESLGGRLDFSRAAPEGGARIELLFPTGSKRRPL